MKKIGFALTLLLALCLCGCAARETGFDELYEALGGADRFLCQKDGIEFIYESIPGGGRCIFSVGGEELTLTLQDGSIRSELLEQESRYTSLPGSCPVSEISRTIGEFLRQCSLKDPQLIYTDGVYTLGGAEAEVRDGVLISLVTPGGITCTPLS